MKTFVIERDVPGAGNFTPEELQAISQTSCEVLNQLNKPYHWIQSFVTNNKVYCIHIAESKEVIQEHSRKGNFPITNIAEVKTIIDPTTGNP